jgi:16S rRNA (cytidine1402-2'-O)-methyltransferase
LWVQKSFEVKQGVLYVVGTPIGNLDDFSPRVHQILSQVDLIAAEDTRHTKKLLSKFSFSTPLVSYHEHNEKKRCGELIEQLKMGKSIALVSDAGMPAISDPGEELVRQAVEQQIAVIPIPGPNAALTALVASGIEVQPFLFLGFLPRAKKERKEELEKWGHLPVTLVFYEAPHRLVAMLEDCLAILGDRDVAISREITKKHEEWLRGKLSECLSYLQQNGTRGEYTIVIGKGETKMEVEGEKWWASLSINEHVEYYIKKGENTKTAIKQTAKDRSIPKREVYQHYHCE